MKVLRALAVALLAAAPLAAQPGVPKFVPGKGAGDRKLFHNHVQVAHGEFDGRKATRIDILGNVPPYGFVVVAVAGAKTWNEARSACRLLAPRGAWDLPMFQEVRLSQEFEGIEPLAGQAGRSTYAAWMRGVDSDEDGDFIGTDQIIVNGAVLTSLARSGDLLSSVNSLLVYCVSSTVE